MSPRAIILAVAAVIAVGATVYFARSWLNAERAAIQAMKKKEPVKVVRKVQVLVAKINLPAGTFLQPKHFAWQSWPDDRLHPSYIRQKAFKQDMLVGAVVRKGISAGEPITEGRIVKPGDRGFMAAVLSPGMRGVTIRVDAVTGVAGFVFPGDRVDILLTHQLASRSGKRVATETLLTNVKILAMDQRANDQKGPARPAKTVTIEVTPKQAEMIAVATNIGRLSLTLRSLGTEQRYQDRILTAGAVLDLDSLTDQPPARGRTHTLDAETSRLLGGPRNTVNVTIVRAAKRSAISFPKAP
jgi:pilus assembly protein CpaB